MLRSVRLASVGARRFSASAKRTSLNADLAEGYGPWTMTADEDLLQIVTTANVACGGHAGDANIMAAVLERAKTTPRLLTEEEILAAAEG